MNNQFTVKDTTVTLEAGDNFIIRTDDNREIYILYVEGKLTICNQSGDQKEVAEFHTDGSISVEEDYELLV